MLNNEYMTGSISADSEVIDTEVESFFESCKDEIDMMFADFTVLKEKVTLESAIMGSTPNDLQMVYESEKENILTKVGKMVIKIFEKIVAVIEKIIDKIKDFMFNKKSDIQKLEILLKKHPELKKEVIMDNIGSLSLSDVRSIKDLDATYEELVKLAEKGNIDPNTLKGKWEKAKEKFKKDSKEWTIVKVAAGVTAAVAIAKFVPELAKVKKESEDRKIQAKEENALTLKLLKDNKHHTKVDDNSGIVYTMTQIYREKHGLMSALHHEQSNRIAKFVNAIASRFDKLIDKLDPKAKERFHYDMTWTYGKIKDREERDYKEKKELKDKYK